jgi:5'-nucleotidase
MKDFATTTTPFTIINKGGLKIGVIKVVASEKKVVTKINTLAKNLRTEHMCNLVVCLSHLGFKNKVVTDDIKLAQQSSHIDIVLSSNLANFSSYPYIAQNRNKEEVIIQSALDNGFGLSNIEIEFDELHTKKLIAFNNLLTRVSETK